MIFQQAAAAGVRPGARERFDPAAFFDAVRPVSRQGLLTV